MKGRPILVPFKEVLPQFPRISMIRGNDDPGFRRARVVRRLQGSHTIEFGFGKSEAFAPHSFF